MFTDTKAFSGFAVDDVEKAREFYGETLGLRTSEAYGMLRLHIAGDSDTLAYPKPDHVPATYTILNFPVDDIAAAVDELTARDVEFERYDGADQDEKGIFRGAPRPGRRAGTAPRGACRPSVCIGGWRPSDPHRPAAVAGTAAGGERHAGRGAGRK